MKKKPKLGSGKRFSDAASAGRKAHGQSAMTRYSKEGRVRSKKK